MKNEHFKALLLIILIIFIVSGCSPFRPLFRESPQGEIPKTFSLFSPVPERSQPWWEEFKDPELNVLVRGALLGDLSIKKAWARLRHANALALKAGSGLYPDLNFTSDGSYERRKTTIEVDNVSGGRTAPTDPVTRQTNKSYSLGLAGSYELDLWGRIRSEQEAARLEASATREDLNAAAITVAAEVTTRWVSIVSQRMQKRLLEKQLETNLTYLELVELRFRMAMVSALDVYQQRQVVAGVRAQIPLVEGKEQLLLHELALLLGKPPRSHMDISRETLPVPERIPATGIPADLLAKRPDIRAAGLRLQTSDWQVAAARANRLPAVSLTAKALYGPAQLDLLFDNWLLGLAANLVAPIFDGKRRAAEVDRTRAVVDENLWAYRETVLTAIKEVEDALVGEEKQRDHVRALQLQINEAKKGLGEARERYRKGIDDYLPVLTQLLAVQRLERDLIQKKTELIVNRVSLYRALGGTWANELRPDAGLPERSGSQRSSASNPPEADKQTS